SQSMQVASTKKSPGTFSGTAFSGFAMTASALNAARIVPAAPGRRGAGARQSAIPTVFVSPGGPTVSADRNLLFGILAVQLDFVTQGALIGAMQAWLLDKAKPLGDILRDGGHLSAEALQHLAALVAVHLKR